MALLVLCGPTLLWAQTPKPPAFINQPRKVWLEGTMVHERLDLWGESWRAARVTFSLLKAPQGMQLSSLGSRGCCRWLAALSWLPQNKDVGTHTVEVQATDDQGKKYTQSFVVQVINQNEPPVIQSTPTVQVQEGGQYRYSLQATDPDPTQDTLTYKLLSAPSGMTLSAQGVVDWQPNENQVGKHSVVVQVLDNQGASTQQSFVLEVQNVEQAPRFLSQPLVGATVGRPYVYPIRAMDPDPGSVLKYQLLSGPKDMVVSAEGVVRWLPQQVGRVNVSVEVEDGTGRQTIQQWAIDVVKTNNIPLITSEPPVVVEQGKLFRYILQAKDDEGESLSFSLFQAPSGMNLNTSSTKDSVELQWTPGADDVGKHAVAVRVADQKGGVVWERFSLLVTNQNDAPVIQSSPVNRAKQGALYRYAVHAVDPDKEPLRYALQQAPSGMTIDPATGLIVWLPQDQALVKAHDVIVSVSDRQGASTQQSFQIVVEDSNDPPVWTSQPPTEVTQGQLYTYQPTVEDKDGASPAPWFRLVEHPATMEVERATGLIRWIPQRNDVGSHRVVMEVVDGRGAATSQAFVVRVKPQNSLPLIVSQPLRWASVGQPYLYRVIAHDPDGLQSADTLIFSVQGPAGMTLQQQGVSVVWQTADTDVLGTRSLGSRRAVAVLVWQPTADDAQRSEIPVVVQVSDGQGGVAEQKFSIKVVTGENRPPQVKKPEQIDVEEGKPFVWKVEAKDPDGDKVSLVLVEGPEGLTVDSASQEIRWTPAFWQQGTWTVKLRVSDEKGGVVWWQTSLKVKPINHPPQIVSVPQLEAFSGAAYSYAVRAVDQDAGDRATLRWTLTQAPSGMSVDAQRGIITWSPEDKDVGSHLVKVQVTDRLGGLSAEQSFQLQVHQSNQPPSIKSTSTTMTVKEGEVFAVQLQAVDPNPGDLLSYQLLKGPNGMTLHPQSGLLQWTPGSKDVGSHAVVWRVQDSQGKSASQTFTLQVEDRNTAPVVVSEPPLGATVGKLYSYTLQIQDAENDTIPTIRLVEKPLALKIQNQMTLDSQTRTIQWLPGAEHANGFFLVWVEVVDQRGAVGRQFFTVHVSANNRAPTWTVAPPTTTVKINEGQSYQVALQAADLDKDPLTYSLLAAPPGVTIQPRSGLLVWMPSAEQVGSHTIAVVVRDGRGGSLQATWTVEVQNRNDPPRIVSVPTQRATPGQMFQYSLNAQDPDPGDKIRWVMQQAPTGMVLDSSSGLLQWTPSSNDAGRIVLVRVRVVDAAGAFDTQTFQLQVEADNRPPQIVSSPPLQATEGQVFGYSVRAEDPDSGSRLHYQLLRGPSGMSIGALDGWLWWTPGNQDVGQAEVSVQVQDEHGASVTQTFTLTVNNTNDAPRFLSVPCTQTAVDTSYKCVLVVEDPDPNTQNLFVNLLRAPNGLQAQVSTGAGGAQPSSVFLVALTWEPKAQDVGLHPVELRVSDGAANDHMLFSLEVGTNEDVPIAIPGDNQQVAPGEIVLNGEKSQDANGLTVGLKYQWRLVQGPASVDIANPTRAQIKVILRNSGTYVFSLVVEKEGKKSAPGFVQVVVRNVAPLAQVWAPLAGEVGEDVLLDGTQSVDTNGDKLLFSWKLWIDNIEQRNWSSSASSLRFSPQRPGVYRFALTVTEDRPAFERPESSTTMTEVVVHEIAQNVFVPYAVIVGPREGNVGQSLELDASRSQNLSDTTNKETIKFQWSIVSGPEGATLSTPNAVTTSFVATKPGYYEVGLVVRNLTYISKQEVWGIAVQGAGAGAQLPIARVISTYATQETWFQLDASQSVDPSGAQLSFAWKQLHGALAELRDGKSARPSFFVLSPSPLLFQLTVQGSGPVSAPVLVQVLTNVSTNKPPIAQAGESFVGDNSRNAGQVVILDGSKSYDPDASDNSQLRFRWRQVSGFPVLLQNPDSVKPSFLPVTYGILRFSLEVYDGIAWSKPSYVDVVVNDDVNKMPYANAGSDQTVRLGQSVSLDGSASYDLDSGDKLQYQWRLIEPMDRQITLNLTDPAHPSFTAKDSTISRYVFGLRVDDGKATSLESTVTVRVNGTNQPPVALIEVGGQAVVGQELILDGSSSSDLDGDSLTYSWKQLSGPPLSLKDTESKILKVRATEEGIYRFQLQVSDSLAQSIPTSIVVQIRESTPTQQGCQCSTGAPSSVPWLGWGLWLFVAGFGLWLRRRRRFAS
ncbi:MAG: tandem-95 repeat protein [Deltaproteobacteria bacterium]|nr:MAG: tandem-95 repeat protein [Deltaproteobacteria bacterium]